MLLFFSFLREGKVISEMKIAPQCFHDPKYSLRKVNRRNLSLGSNLKIACGFIKTNISVL